MGALQLEDLYGLVHCAIFGSLFNEVKNMLKEGDVILLQAIAEHRVDDVRLIAKSIQVLPPKNKQTIPKVKEAKCIFHSNQANKNIPRQVGKIVREFKGTIPTTIDMKMKDCFVFFKKVNLTQEGVNRLKNTKGVEVIERR